MGWQRSPITRFLFVQAQITLLVTASTSEMKVCNRMFCIGVSEDHRVTTHLYWHICCLGAPNRKHQNLHYLSPDRGQKWSLVITQWNISLKIQILKIQLWSLQDCNAQENPLFSALRDSVQFQTVCVNRFCAGYDQSCSMQHCTASLNCFQLSLKFSKFSLKAVLICETSLDR